MSGLVSLTSTQSFNSFVQSNFAVVVVFTNKDKIESNQYLVKLSPLTRQVPGVAWGEVPTHLVETEDVDVVPVTSGYVRGKYIGAFDGNNISLLYQLLDRINAMLGRPERYSSLSHMGSMVEQVQYQPTPVAPVVPEVASKPVFQPNEAVTLPAAPVTTANPRQVRSLAEIQQAFATSNGMVLYKKIGCGHCDDFWPSYVAVAKENPRLTMLYCMSNDYYPMGILGFPHTEIYKSGRKIDELIGGNVIKLKTAAAML